MISVQLCGVLVVWLSGSFITCIKIVTLHRAWLVLGWVHHLCM